MNKKYLLLILLFLVSAHQLSVTQAATLHVAKNGHGTGCSMNIPCGSIQNAIDAASPYDHIVIRKGEYYENITIPMEKPGLVLKGAGKNKTKIIAPDLPPVKFAPPTVPAEIIIDILAPEVKIKNLAVVHPRAKVDKRDIGIFVRPSATNVTLANLKVKRMRIGENLEPFMPGSRGVLVFRATGTTIANSDYRGNYEDHIHLPTSQTLVKGNEIDGATRLGIVVIQENETSLSTDNIIVGNEVEDSGSDGIQIQGDNNIVKNNEVEDNGGYGIHLCGPTSSPACVAPGQIASADNNVVSGNDTEDNELGDVADNGVNNSID